MCSMRKRRRRFQYIYIRGLSSSYVGGVYYTYIPRYRCILDLACLPSTSSSSMYKRKVNRNCLVIYSAVAGLIRRKYLAIDDAQLSGRSISQRQIKLRRIYIVWERERIKANYEILHRWICALLYDRWMWGAFQSRDQPITLRRTQHYKNGGGGLSNLSI